MESTFQVNLAAYEDLPPPAKRDAPFETIKNLILGQDNYRVEGAKIEAWKSTKQGVILTLGTLGSYAIGQDMLTEPTPVSIAGTPTQGTFYSLIRNRIRSSSSKVVIEGSDQDAYVMFKLFAHDCRFNLSYHQVSQDLIDRIWTLEEIPDGIPTPKKRHYLERAKAMQLSQVFKDSIRNQRFIMQLTLWARQRGLYSRTFNFLKSDSVLCLTAVAVDRMEQMPGDPGTSESFMLAVSSIYTSTIPSLQHSKHPFIRAPKLPSINTVSSLILSEIQAIPKLLGSPPNLTTLNPLAESHKQFLRLDLSYWGFSKLKLARLLHEAERILGSYLSRLDIRLFPKLKMRLWPQRLKSGRPQDSSKVISSLRDPSHPTVPSDIKACWLVGADYTDEVPEDVLKSIPVLLRDEIVRSPPYDLKLAFVEAEWVETIDPMTLVPDTGNHGPIPEAKKPGDDDDDNENDGVGNEPPSAEASKKRHKTMKTTQESSEAAKPAGEPKSPLRPAMDVLNRIRNDHGMDSADYLIGYLDRHAGLKEMPVESWIMKEETAEDFIPQSRIRYFKRMSDGVTVWDREARLDLVFGSGKKTQG